MEAMDERRFELYEELKPTLGEGTARKLVLMLPPDPEKLVRMQDLERLKEELVARLDVGFAQTRAEMAEMRSENREMRAELTAAIAAVNAQLTAGISETNARLGSAISETNARLGSAIAETNARLGSAIAEADGRHTAAIADTNGLISRLEGTLTRRMVSVLGAWTVVAGAALGWAAILLRA